MATRGAFEVEGEWWLAGRAERRVAGRLRFDPESGGRLRLIGVFHGMFDGGESTERDGVITTVYTRESLERAGAYPRIFGVAGGRRYTLEDCLRTRAVQNLTGGGTESISVEKIYEGAHFDGDEPPSADAISVDLRYLTHWVSAGGIRESHFLPGEESSAHDLRVRLEAQVLEDQVAALRGDASVKLTHSLKVTGDRVTERGLSQKHYLRIETAGLQAVDELLDQVGSLQDLVSIAVGRTAEIDGLRLWAPEAAIELNGKTLARPVKLSAQWNNRDTSKTPGSLPLHDLYFTYDDFGGIEAIGRWLDQVAEYRSAISRTVASRYAQGIFVSDRLLNSAAALESFDRIRNGEGIFHVRMERCAALAGEPFTELVGDVQRWIKVVKGHRNDVAHHLESHVQQSGPERFFLARSLYWLFVYCILRHVDVPEKVFEKISRHESLLRMGAQVRAAIAVG